MKKLLLTAFAIFIHLNAPAQVNKITTDQFRNIKFNGVSIAQIAKTNGAKDKMGIVLGNSLSDRSYALPVVGKEYQNSILFIRFEDDSGQGLNYSLAFLEVKSATVAIEVMGNLYRIGDDISKFGRLYKIQTLEDTKVVFVEESTESASLDLRFDKTTGKMYEIKLNFY